ncbi:hypothetical protein [Nocardia sp. NBC_00403]|uniref:hypothetical protein n=1 Tax=Nocardia sp. NBC_00403 TaxID=2975990 RepID=UPI002E23BE31
MPNNHLPQRDPLNGPPVAYAGAKADVVDRFATALRKWAGPPTATESTLRWANESAVPGAHNPLSN